VLLLAPVVQLAWGADPAAPAPPANAATAQELPQVSVIGNAPLPGFGLPLNMVPANVQTANSEDLERAQTLGVADYLNRNFSGVNVSESADNPFQLDVYYHGFTASPLLGTPEGLSVYVDGVRVNESFGDTVNWDLIPESAISTVSLISGQSGIRSQYLAARSPSDQERHDNPGTQFESLRRLLRTPLISGGKRGERGAFDYFGTVQYFDEDGWRDIRRRPWQAFGKAGWQTEHTDLDLSYRTPMSLYGNGAVPRACTTTAIRQVTRRTSPTTCSSCEPHRHAVHRASAASPQRLLPAPDHRQQQWQQQRQLPDDGYRGRP
jgi:hypothetical protein